MPPSHGCMLPPRRLQGSLLVRWGFRDSDLVPRSLDGVGALPNNFRMQGHCERGVAGYGGQVILLSALGSSPCRMAGGGLRLFTS